MSIENSIKNLEIRMLGAESAAVTRTIDVMADNNEPSYGEEDGVDIALPYGTDLTINSDKEKKNDISELDLEYASLVGYGDIVKNIKDVKVYLSLVNNDLNIEFVGAFISRLSPIFVSAIDKLSNTILPLQKLYIKDKTTKSISNTIVMLGSSVDKLSKEQFHKFSKLVVPVYVGMKGDYLYVSNRLIGIGEDLDFVLKNVKELNSTITKFISNINQDRLSLIKLPTTKYDSINNRLKDVTDSKQFRDRLPLEKVVPNFSSLKEISRNFLAILSEINDDKIKELSSAVNELANTMIKWSDAMSKNEDTKYSKTQLDIMANISGDVAEAITSVGLLTSAAYHYSTMYIMGVDLVKDSL